MGNSQLKQYAAVYDRAIPGLGKGYDDRSESGLRDMATHRRLCHATVAPDLDQFYHGEVASTGKKSLESWLEKYKADNGAAMYWTWTRPATKLDPPGNRDEYAYDRNFREADEEQDEP